MVAFNFVSWMKVCDAFNAFRIGTPVNSTESKVSHGFSDSVIVVVTSCAVGFDAHTVVLLHCEGLNSISRLVKKSVLRLRRDYLLHRDVCGDNVQRVLCEDDPSVVFLDTHDGFNGRGILCVRLDQHLGCIPNTDTALLLETVLIVIQINGSVLLECDLSSLNHYRCRRC